LADAQGRDNADAMDVLRSVEGIEALGCTIGRRKAFPNAFSAGLSVVEQVPRDAKAFDELMAVVDALYAQGVDNGHQDARKAG
jgi:chromosome partitioning protein